MSGQNVLTTLGRDEMAAIFKKHITKFRLGEGGFVMSPLITEEIDAGATGVDKTYSYTISGGDFPIIGVDTVAKTFTIVGDHTALYVAGERVGVIDSTGNDGFYTVTSAILLLGNTVIFVSEAIPNAVADGDIYLDRLPICKGPSGGLFHFSTEVVELNGVTEVQKLQDMYGIGTLEQTLGGSSGTGTMNYKSGTLDVTFENYVGLGNRVVVRFKYANVPKLPTAGQEDLDSALDTEGPLGGSSMYTFEKSFQASDLVLRGVGYATLRCTMLLTEPEGIDDGFLGYGGTPYFFEGGIFDDDGVMLCYFTFDKERKTGSVTITHTVDFVV